DRTRAPAYRASECVEMLQPGRAGSRCWVASATSRATHGTGSSRRAPRSSSGAGSRRSRTPVQRARRAAGVRTTSRSGKERVSSVHVNFCRPQDAEALVARGWLRRSGYQYHWTNAGFRSFDEYLASLRSKRRNQVRRERRELTAQGVEITVYAGGDIPDALFPRMFELYRRTVAELPWGRQYLDRRFFTLARDRLRDRLCFVVAR